MMRLLKCITDMLYINVYFKYSYAQVGYMIYFTRICRFKMQFEQICYEFTVEVL